METTLVPQEYIFPSFFRNDKYYRAVNKRQNRNNKEVWAQLPSREPKYNKEVWPQLPSREPK